MIEWSAVGLMAALLVGFAAGYALGLRHGETVGELRAMKSRHAYRRHRGHRRGGAESGESDR